MSEFAFNLFHNQRFLRIYVKWEHSEFLAAQEVAKILKYEEAIPTVNKGIYSLPDGYELEVRDE